VAGVNIEEELTERIHKTILMLLQLGNCIACF